MVSNKTLSIALMVVLTFSVVSMKISLDRVGNIDYFEPTGFATSQSGTANLTILASTDIILPNNSIEFGTGVVNISVCDNATLHTNGSGLNQDNCWINSSIDPAVVNPVVTDKFLIVNIGNVNATLSIASARGNASWFIGNATSGASSVYNWTAWNNETGSCTSGLQDEWTNFSTSTVCSNLRFVPDNNSVNVSIYVRIPGQIDSTGYKNDTLTFTSAQA